MKIISHTYSNLYDPYIFQFLKYHWFIVAILSWTLDLKIFKPLNRDPDNISDCAYLFGVSLIFIFRSTKGVITQIFWTKNGTYACGVISLSLFLAHFGLRIRLLIKWSKDPIKLREWMEQWVLNWILDSLLTEQRWMWSWYNDELRTSNPVTMVK